MTTDQNNFKLLISQKDEDLQKLKAEKDHLFDSFKTLQDSLEKSLSDNIAKDSMIKSFQEENSLLFDLVSEYSEAFTLAEFDPFDKKFLIAEIGRLRRLNSIRSTSK